MATMETIESEDDAESYRYRESTAKTRSHSVSPRSPLPSVLKGQFANQFRGMKEAMLKESLMLATRLKSKKDLQKAIKDYKESGLSSSSSNEYTEAVRELDVIKTREALKRGVVQKDANLVRDTLSRLHEKDKDYMVKRGKKYDESKSFRAQLQMDIQKATRFLKNLENKKDESHKLTRAVMTEISAYTTPPRGVHATMQALFLLMGEDEYTTSEWQFCTRQLHPREFQKRMMKFDPNDCNPELVARAYEILDGILYEDILKSSRAGATFYVFALGTVEEFDSMQSVQRIRPARVQRQREILGRRWPIDAPKSSKSDRERVEKPRVLHQGFNSYKHQYL